MNLKVKGTILGIVSAVSYGTNPLGALFLYQEGLNSNSVLFYRFSLAAVVLACILFIQKQSFRLSRKEVKTLCLLGILFAVSSLTFYTSFHHMDAGIASTLLFVYPIMVAVIMSLFFKERISPVTMFSIILALSGIALLYRGGTGAGLNGLGVSLVMIASLTYALYIVVINQSSIKLSSIKLTFYVLLFCMVAIVFHSFFDGSNYLQPLTYSTYVAVCYHASFGSYGYFFGDDDYGRSCYRFYTYGYYGCIGASHCRDYRCDRVW